MPERSKDWMNQAEKAIKAVFQKLNAVTWGYSIFDLVKILSKKVEVNKELLNCARSLDKILYSHQTSK